MTKSEQSDDGAPEHRSRGRREYVALIGSQPEDALAELRLRSRQLYEDVIEGAFGGPLARSELGRAAQETATVRSWQPAEAPRPSSSPMQ